MLQGLVSQGPRPGDTMAQHTLRKQRQPTQSSTKKVRFRARQGKKEMGEKPTCNQDLRTVCSREGGRVETGIHWTLWRGGAQKPEWQARRPVAAEGPLPCSTGHGHMPQHPDDLHLLFKCTARKGSSRVY